MYINKMKKIIEKIIYYTIPVVLLLWFSQTIFSNSIWLDEAFSLSMIQQSFLDIIKNTAIDVHPPLYYIILKSLSEIIDVITKNIVWTTKLISLIPIVLLLIIDYTTIKKLFGKRTSFLFAIFILGMPQILKYAIEIRMYSWSMLFVTLVYVYCIKWLEKSKNKDLCMMLIFTILSAYTHYFAAVSVACIYMFLLIYILVKKDYARIKKLIFSILIVFVVYLPWLIVLIKQISVVKEGYWIEPITLNSIESFLKFPYVVNGNKILTLIIGVFAILAFIILIIKRKEQDNKYAICGFLVPIGTILIGIIASKIIRPVFISRYMVCSLGCLWLAVSIMLGKQINKKYIFVAIVILSILVSTKNINIIIDSEKLMSRETDKTLEYLDTLSKENTILIFDNNQLQRTVAYYYPETEIYVYKREISKLTEQVYKQTNMYMRTLEELKEIDNTNKKIYLFVMRDELLETAVANGYECNSCGKYKIENYKFSVYESIK